MHPNKNTVRVYMNSKDQIFEWIDIDNIPLRKWVHMAIVVRNKDMDIYVNGFLKVRKTLSSLPRQNDGNVWVNMYGGFEGYMSRIRYYSRAIHYSDIESAIKTGPSSSSCVDTGESPPYLDDNWWN